jgi:lysozyme
MTLVEQLVLHEGLRLTPYVDTVGKITIGVGRNLTDRGITEAQAYAWLDEDIAVAVRELTARFPWFAALEEIRRRVLIDMHINLGMQRLKGFRQFLGYVEAQDYRKAAEEMLASRWATQVGGRATRLAGMMRTGTV